MRMYFRTWFRCILAVAGAVGLAVEAADPPLPVPNYDQDLFPIDRPYGEDHSEGESGDCTPVASAMIHGFYDPDWPRLIPFGGAAIVRELESQPYKGNAWGVDTVVRAYKAEYDYRPNEGVLFLLEIDDQKNRKAKVLRAVIRKFDPAADLPLLDTIAPTWEDMRTSIDGERPFVLSFFPWTTEFTVSVPVLASRASLPATGRRSVVLARVGFEAGPYLRMFDAAGAQVYDGSLADVPPAKAGFVRALREVVDPLFIMGRSEPTAEEATAIGRWLVPIVEDGGYLFEGDVFRSALTGAHTVTAKGWVETSDQGQWIVANMGWGHTKDAWINRDGSDRRYVAYVQLEGTGSPEDDDPNPSRPGGIAEDNDILAEAAEIERGKVYEGLRCRDTLIVNNDYANSYGDWYKVRAVLGRPLGVTIDFRNAEGNLDVRLFDAERRPVAASETLQDLERVGVASAQSEVYYVFVYGFRGAKNERYSIAVDKLPVRVRPAERSYRRTYGSASPEVELAYDLADFLPGDGPGKLVRPPAVEDPGVCAPVGDYELWPVGGVDPIYAFVPSGAPLEVARRVLTVTLKGEARRIEGNPNPPFSPVWEGLAGDCDGEADVALTWETDANEASPPGVYEVKPRVAGTYRNYDITPKPGPLRVEPKSESLAWVSEAAPALLPRAAMDASGTVHVVYREGERVVYRRTNPMGQMLSSTLQVFENGNSPDVAVGRDGQVHVVARTADFARVQYVRLNAAGNEVARGSVGPTASANADHWVYSPRIALDYSDGSGSPVVGVIESTEPRAIPVVWVPVPVLVAFTWWMMGYDLVLEATFASAERSIATDRVVHYRLDAAGESVGKRTVHSKSRRGRSQAAKEEMSMAVDQDGTVYLAWKEYTPERATNYWKAGHAPAEAEPQVLAAVERSREDLGAPELAASGGKVAAAWSWERGIRLQEIQPNARTQPIDADVHSFQRIGLAPAGDFWRVAWVDQALSQLFDQVLGWDSSGQQVRWNSNRRVGVATVVGSGKASDVVMPALASHGAHWALVFAAKKTEDEHRRHVAIYLPEAVGGAPYGLTPGSALWDRSDYSASGSDAPVRVLCNGKLLREAQSHLVPVEGVVADGVTPLLFRFREVRAEDVRVAVTTAQAGAAGAVSLLESKLRVAGPFDGNGQGVWQSELVSVPDPGEPERFVHAKLDGIALDELAAWGVTWPAAGAQELVFELGLYRNASGPPQPADRLAGVRFVVRKPPVIMVHDEATTGRSWADAVRTSVRSWAGDDGVVFLDYGTELVPGAPATKPEYYRNRGADLRTLRAALSDELVAREDAFRQRWAMTRYDVVGHGQGGVLLRLLCADEFGSGEGFVNERNFGRGRFRRVITVGAPHRGARLSYFAGRLREELAALGASCNDGCVQLGAALSRFESVLRSDKFDPFDIEAGTIGEVNANLPTHGAARFHLIGTVVDHNLPMNRAQFGGLGLRGEAALDAVIPRFEGGGLVVRRSDGATELASQVAGVAEFQRTIIDEPVAVSNQDFFCAPAGQTTSTRVGWVVKELLEAAEAAGRFGPFGGPEDLAPGDPSAIDQRVAAVLGGLAGGESDAKLAVLSGWRELVDKTVHISVTAVLPPEQVPVTDVRWVVRVYSPDPEAERPLEQDRCEEESGGKTIVLPPGLRAQVVVMAIKAMAGDEVWASPPTLVYDNLSEHIRGLVVVGVPGELSRGERHQAGVLAELEEGVRTEFFQGFPEVVSWRSSDSVRVAVDPMGWVTTPGGLGRAELKASYLGWQGTLEVEVKNRMPGVAIFQPREDDELRVDQKVTVEVVATDPDGGLLEVELYLRNTDYLVNTAVLDGLPVLNGQAVARWLQPPYTWVWDQRRPGNYELLARARDVNGGSGESKKVNVKVLPQPPAVAWVKPAVDAWVSGAVQLKSIVIDPDPYDTVLVYYEYSLNSTNGWDGDWFPCAAAVSADPYETWWQSEPQNGVDDQVWLRLWAVDSYGLELPYVPWRVRVDNAFGGVTFDPHPGESEVALDRGAEVRFSVTPRKADDTAISGGELMNMVTLRDATNAVVPCIKEVLNGGLTVRLRPNSPLGPRQSYTIQVGASLKLGAQVVPPVSSTFQTTFGPPAGLRVLGWPLAPQAGEVWQPPLEVMLVDAGGNRVENATAKIVVSLRSAAGVAQGSYESQALQGVARYRAVRSEAAGWVEVALSCPELSLQGNETIQVLPGPLAGFTLEVAQEMEAGQPMALGAAAYDRFGNLKDDYVGVPVLSSGDDLAALKALPAFRTSDRGRRSYSNVGTLRSLGQQWLQLHAGEAVSPRETVRVRNAAPPAPRPVAPVGLAGGGLSPRLEASAFADQDNATHGASQWQISSRADFETLAWDSGEAGPLTQAEVPGGILAPGTVYYWRVRHRDDPPTAEAARWSDWSVSASMRTAQGFPFADDFSADRGWRGGAGGFWARTAASGLPTGSPTDDTSAGEDRQILTTATGGGPPGDWPLAERVVSPPVDCSGQPVVELSFQRWLQIDASDWAEAEVAVSVDGANWTPVWRHAGGAVADDAWQLERVDITALAAGQPTVYVGFSIGPLVNAQRLAGWHLDDVRLDRGVEDQIVATLSGPAGSLVAGEEFEVRLLVREQVAEANGVLGGSFDLVYDAAGFQLLSPADPRLVVQAPFNEVMAVGTFAAGRITGLGGATLTEGAGNGQDALFAVLRFRGLQSGQFGMMLTPGSAGYVLTAPVGLVGTARVQMSEPLAIQIEPPTVIPLLEFELTGPVGSVGTGELFDVRVAVRENHGTARGFFGGAVDLFFDESMVEPVAPLNLAAIVNTNFQSLGILSGSMAESRIDELGGVTLTEGQGDGAWVEYLRVPFRARGPGRPIFTLGPGQAGLVLASSVGPVALADVAWGGPLEVAIGDWPQATVTPAVPAWWNRTELDLLVGGAEIVEYRYASSQGGWSEAAPVTQPLRLQGLREGAHELLVVGRNVRGVWQAEADATRVNFSVDTVPPAPPSLGSSDPPVGAWSARPETAFQWNVGQDGQSGILGYRVAWTGTATPPTMEGLPVGPLPLSYAFAGSGVRWGHVLAVDRAGNPSSLLTIGPLRYDGDAPQVGLAAQVPANGEIRIPLSVTDTHSGVASATWSVVGGVAENVVLSQAGPEGVTVQAKANGSYTLQVLARDQVGNQVSRTVEVLFQRQAPRVLDLSVAGGATTTTESLVPVELTPAAGDAGRLEYEIQVDGLSSGWLALGAVSGPQTVMVDLGSEDGRKEVCVRLRDADYPYAAFTTEAACGVVWLDRQTWSFTIQTPGAVHPDVRFGESARATDGFDEGLDVRATIADPWENQVRLSQLQGGASVYADYKQTRPDQEWLLVVAAGASSIDMSWTSASMPSSVYLEIVPAKRFNNQWVPNGEATSLRAIAGMSVGLGSQFFLLRKLAAPEVNTAPAVAAQPLQTVAELATLNLTMTATDSDRPAQTLTFSLVNPPGGASIHSTSGVFSWTPTEAQGPGTYTITVVATDNGTPAFSGTNTFQVNVTEANTAPAAALALVGFDGSGFRFTLTGQPRARYTIEFSTDMAQWSDRDTVTLGDGPGASYTDARAVGGTLGFYRVRSQ